MKDPIETLGKLQDGHFVYILSVCALIAPTILAISLFFNSYFLTLNFFTLIVIVISCGIMTTLPSFFLAIGRTYSKEKGDELNGRWGIMLFTAISCALGILFTLLEAIYYIFFMQFGFTAFITIVALISFFISPLIILLVTKDKKSNNLWLEQN